MPDAVYQVLTLLCTLVAPLPVGTNLGLLHLLWMLVSGHLLGSRGAVIPGLSALGLSDAAVRRAGAALGQGRWTSAALLGRWAALVQAEGRWQAHTHGGYRPVAVDVTGFWRPRLRGCPTAHYHAQAGKALPAIPLGIVARVGSVAGQRLGLPLGLVRADPADPRPPAHLRRLLGEAVARCAPDDALVVDREFGVGLLQEVGATRYVARLPKNFTARRASPRRSGGRGGRATRGVLVRPRPRQRQGRAVPATPPDRSETWAEGAAVVRAEVWAALVLPDAPPASPTFAVVAIHDPCYREPLLLATPLALTPQAARDLYRDRWPVEQLPLAAKQMLGAARQFVHAPETCQRLPELALLAGSVLSYAAATQPAVPTGFWDRRPAPTPGRRRRVLARYPFPHDYPLPARLREKAAVTAHLPKGWFGHRRRATSATAAPAPPRQPPPSAEAA